MHPRITRALAMSFAFAVGVGLVNPSAVFAAQAVDQSYWVPANKIISLVGHGFGHGHGMSQYGAQGAAKKGLNATQILGFYYPGTTLATTNSDMRVRISADTDNDTTVLPRTGLAVRDLATLKTYLLPTITGLKQWRIRAVGGKSQLAYLTTSWIEFRPAGLQYLAGDGEFFAPAPITLVTPSGQKAYRGTLRAASPTPGTAERDTVNVVTLDDYVRGVVSAEMPSSWMPAALQAQTIAARTFASFTRDANLSKYYQICDTSSCQVYGGVARETVNTDAAVDATKGKILTYNAKAAFTQFSASSGGQTSAGSVPYLPSKADPYDDFVGNGVHTWTAAMDVRVLERKYPTIGALQRIRVTSRQGAGQWLGRIGSVVLDGSKADVTISGDTLRSIYGLRSTFFTFSATKIIYRWALSGEGIGSPLAAEYVVSGGVAQNFANGRIFYKTGAASAWEMWGSTLPAYVKLGATSSRLGFPTGQTRYVTGGHATPFEHGDAYARSSTGAVTFTYK